MNQKPLFLAVAFLVLLVVGGAFWCVQKQQMAVNQPVVTGPIVGAPTLVQAEPETPIDTSDWKTYRNEQIGIQFEYPTSWGDINLSREVGCVDYYAEEVIVPKDVKDSCLHISLSASNFNHGFFLSTEGVDFTKTGIPKGVDWRFRMIFIQKGQENFCSNNPYTTTTDKGRGGDLGECVTFKNNQNLTVVKGTRGVPFTEQDRMVAYFVRSLHPVFYDVVLSGQYLKSPFYPQAEDDIKKLVDTIRFFRD